MRITLYGGPADGAHIIMPEHLIYAGFVVSVPLTLPPSPFDIGPPSPTFLNVAYVIEHPHGQSPQLVFLPISRT